MSLNQGDYLMEIPIEIMDYHDNFINHEITRAWWRGRWAGRNNFVISKINQMLPFVFWREKNG